MTARVSVVERVITELDARVYRDAVGQQGGQRGLDVAALQRIIDDDPMVAELYVLSAVLSGEERGRGVTIVMAVLLTQARSDQSLLRLMARKGWQLPPFKLLAPDGTVSAPPAQPESGPPPDAKPVEVITADELRAGAAGKLVGRLRGLDAADARALHGKLALLFPTYRDDPRDDFFIPEIRRYLAAVDAAVPHLAAFLTPFAAVLVQTYFFSLFPEHWFKFHVDIWVAAFPPEDVLAIVRPRVRAVRAHCATVGGDAEAILRSWVPVFASNQDETEAWTAIFTAPTPP